MSAKAVSELFGKELLYKHLANLPAVQAPVAVRVCEGEDFDNAVKNSSWLLAGQKAVIKPDQLIKRRGKHGLVKCGDLKEIKQWFNEKAGTYATVGKTTGRLNTFIVEPFCAHTDGVNQASDQVTKVTKMIYEMMQPVLDEYSWSKELSTAQ